MSRYNCNQIRFFLQTLWEYIVLTIENRRQSIIRTVLHFSVVIPCTVTWYIPNNSFHSLHLTVSMMLEFSLNIWTTFMTFYNGVDKICPEKSMSQIFKFSLVFISCQKRVTFGHFLRTFFSRVHEIELR